MSSTLHGPAAVLGRGLPPGGEPAPSRSDGPAWRWVATTGLFVFLVLLTANRHLLRTAIAEDGDAAANSLLVDQAKALELVTGNYSRLGFSHPGPSFLYVQALGEALWHDLLGLAASPFGGQNIGVLALNALMIGLAAGVLAKRAGAAGAAALLGAVALLGVSEPGLLSSTWMPYQYICPFLLFTVATGTVARGCWGDLWVFVLTGSLLVHGHVAFTLFAGLGALTVLGAAILRRRRGVRDLPGRRDWAPAAGVLALFALPMLWHLLADWPGELSRYWAYTQSDAPARGSLSSGLTYVAGLVRVDGPYGVLAVLLVVALAVLAHRLPVSRQRGVADGVLLSAGVLTSGGLLYAVRGIDDLSQRYVGLFLTAVPVAVVAAAAIYADLLARGRLRRAAQVAGALLLVGVSVAVWQQRALIANPDRGSSELQAMRAALRTLPAGPVALRFETPAWPPAVGLLEQARRDGREVCVADEVWAFLVTDRNICTPEQLSSTRLLVVRPAAVSPPGAVLYRGNAWTISD